MNTALSINALSYHYGDRLALDKLDLEVQQGEFFALLGPNGSGKSTLFKIMATLLPVQTGEVSLLGLDVRQAGNSLRQKLGIVFQSPALDDELTVSENLMHSGHLYGIRGKQLQDSIAELTELLKISDRLNERVERLSGGLKRRVELVRAFIHKPQLLLLDEPTTGLDPGSRHEFWQFVRTLQKNNDLSVLFTTHWFEEAEECDRIAILHEGKLACCGKPQSLISKLGSNILTVSAENPEDIMAFADDRQINKKQLPGEIRFESENARELMDDILKAFPDSIKRIAIKRPSLSDVYIREIGELPEEEDG